MIFECELQRVIVSYGAVKVVVPGIFPNGCFPIYLTLFQTNDSSAYDQHRCLKDFNAFAYYHNEKLQEAIQELKKEYPDVVIVYGDYYRAFLWLFDHAVELGEPNFFFLLSKKNLLISEKIRRCKRNLLTW